jgi:hypothetical protein
MFRFVSRYIGVVCAVVASVVSVPAFAALPAGATAAFTDLGTDAGTMIDSGWTLVVLVVGGLLLIKLFRKILSKST